MIKTSLAITLLSTAIQATQELYLAQAVQQNMQAEAGAYYGENRHGDQKPYGPHMPSIYTPNIEGRHYYPPGYAPPVDTHAYYPGFEHQYRYRPDFESTHVDESHRSHEEDSVVYAPSKMWFQTSHGQVPAPHRVAPAHKNRASKPLESFPGAIRLQALKEESPSQVGDVEEKQEEIPKSLQPLLAPMFQEMDQMQTGPVANPYGNPFLMKGSMAAHPQGYTMASPYMQSPQMRVMPYGATGGPMPRYPQQMGVAPMMPSAMPGYPQMPSARPGYSQMGGPQMRGQQPPMMGGGMMTPVMGGQPMGYQYPAARGTPLAPVPMGPQAPPTQITKPYDYSQVGQDRPLPTSAYHTPYQTDPLSEIGWGRSPMDEFGGNVYDKQWIKTLTDPEADPRFGTQFKRGFQIDQRPFKMKQKAEKRKAKRDKKPKYKKGKKGMMAFNEAGEAEENTGIPSQILHYNNDDDRYFDDYDLFSEGDDDSDYDDEMSSDYDDDDFDQYYDDSEESSDDYDNRRRHYEREYEREHEHEHDYDDHHYDNEFDTGRGHHNKQRKHPTQSSKRSHYETTGHQHKQQQHEKDLTSRRHQQPKEQQKKQHEQPQPHKQPDFSLQPAFEIEEVHERPQPSSHLHPISEHAPQIGYKSLPIMNSKKITATSKYPEPEFITRGGREFALLDWGMELDQEVQEPEAPTPAPKMAKKPKTVEPPVQYDDEYDSEYDEEDYDPDEELAQRMHYQTGDYHDFRTHKEDQEQRDREQKERRGRERDQKERDERDRRDKQRAEQEREEKEQEAKDKAAQKQTRKSKKQKKDKKSKKTKKSRGNRRNDLDSNVERMHMHLTESDSVPVADDIQETHYMDRQIDHEELEWLTPDHHAWMEPGLHQKQHQKQHEYAWPDVSLEPSQHDLEIWDDERHGQKWFGQEHDQVLKHRDQHYHDAAEEYEEEGHRGEYHHAPEHTPHITWPFSQEQVYEHYDVDHDHGMYEYYHMGHDEGEDHDYADDDEHDVESDDERIYRLYEDSHMHAPLRHHQDDPMVDSFKKATFHGISPVHHDDDTHQVKERHPTRQHQEPRFVPLIVPAVAADEHHEEPKHDDIPVQHHEDVKAATPFRTPELHTEKPSDETPSGHHLKAKVVTPPIVTSTLTQAKKAAPVAAPASASASANPSSAEKKEKKNEAYYYGYDNEGDYSDNDEFFNEAVTEDEQKAEPIVLKKQEQKMEKEPFAPLRRPAARSPYPPRSHYQNESPMYATRPYLEDPIYLQQPTDYEMEMLHHYSEAYLN